VYAGNVASRFPWLEFYTPVNEPLPTARFSGVYGCWYPHHTNEKSFIKILLNQLKGIVLSMQEIRKINPDAKLVQTEDLAKIHSTPLLKYQADFENERRWLTYDALCGKVDRHHYFWNYFLSLGIAESELQFFIDHPCVPHIFGFNYYVTSERYLDEKVELYPDTVRGGNGKHVYADIAAVRAIQPSGLKSLLQEAWERYHLTLAVTEVHMNCSREEQLRWFKETWDACCELRKEGIDVKAVTAWSLLGAYDWNSLLTRDERVYETGVFDIAKRILRPTAIAKLVASLAKEGNYHHPVIREKGWWHRSFPGNHCSFSNSEESPLLIFGCNGTLGSAFVRICEGRRISYRGFCHNEVDISNVHQIENVISQYKPWAIVNAAGYVKVDEAEEEREKCFQLNADAPSLLASICNSHGIQLITFSSDLVFDGEKQFPYIEEDSVKPLNVYGQSKAQAELQIMKNFPSSLIIRTSAFFGPWDRYNFAFNTLNLLKEDRQIVVAKDVIVSPTYVPDLVNASLDLLIDGEKGIWHLSNNGVIAWSDFANELAQRGGFQRKKIVSCWQHELPWRAVRPTYSVLKSDKGMTLPSLENAVDRYFEEKIM
jgi:dTDP-4-dehydrorhamnose reductase